jgi:hypothetical protein
MSREEMPIDPKRMVYGGFEVAVGCVSAAATGTKERSGLAPAARRRWGEAIVVAPVLGASIPSTPSEVRMSPPLRSPRSGRPPH